MVDKKFRVPLLQRLKFLVALAIHYIGSNKSLKNEYELSDSLFANSTSTFLKDLASIRKTPLKIGTALNNGLTKEKLEIIGNEFNSITPENALKWGSLLKDNTLGIYDFSIADKIVNFAVSRNISIHGHALIWGKLPGMGYPKNLHEEINATKSPRNYLLEIMENHIATVLSHYNGRIGAWDVVNEPFELSGSRLDNNIFLQNMGTDYIEQSFRIAHSIDPQVRLVLNEQIDHYRSPRAQQYLSLIENLLKKNTPIHTIGIQSHILFELPSVKDVSWFLRKISEFGLSFEITEFDLRIGLFKYARNPYQAQADYSNRFLEEFMKHSGFLGMTFWSCFDKENWMNKDMPFSLLKPNSPSLFNSKMMKKPIYQTVSMLLRN